MTTGVGRAVFVDTNVLVFAASSRAPLHTTATQTLAQLRRVGNQLWISRQIMREYMATLSRTQTFSAPLSPMTLAADIAVFERRFAVAEDGPASTAELLRIIQSVHVGGRQIHDANIVATMLAYGITRLLTNNVADFARYSALITIEPLV